MPVDESYPGLDEPLTGVGDAEQRHRRQRRRGEQHLALYRLALDVRGVRVLFARDHTLRRPSGSKVGDRPVIGSYPRPLWRSRWRAGRSLHLGVIGHAGAAASSMPASQKTMPHGRENSGGRGG